MRASNGTIVQDKVHSLEELALYSRRKQGMLVEVLGVGIYVCTVEFSTGMGGWQRLEEKVRTTKSTKTYGTDLGLSTCFRQWRAKHSHCQLMHGYSLGFKLVFECDEVDERGWVLDFGGLREFKSWLSDNFDHVFCVAEDDPELERFKTLAATGVCKLSIMPGVGCENFAKYVFEYLEKFLELSLKEGKLLNPTVRVHSVEVFEHGANSAIYSR